MQISPGPKIKPSTCLFNNIVGRPWDFSANLLPLNNIPLCRRAELRLTTCVFINIVGSKAWFNVALRVNLFIFLDILLYPRMANGPFSMFLVFNEILAPVVLRVGGYPQLAYSGVHRTEFVKL